MSFFFHWKMEIFCQLIDYRYLFVMITKQKIMGCQQLWMFNYIKIISPMSIMYKFYKNQIKLCTKKLLQKFVHLSTAKRWYELYIFEHITGMTLYAMVTISFLIALNIHKFWKCTVRSGHCVLIVGVHILQWRFHVHVIRKSHNGPYKLSTQIVTMWCVCSSNGV